ncbi:hypothetical protein DVH24_015029 [Malus domestica]|uniref:Uncharacterized protein n=1 Tax=Malus domestica TaxID=3750 RepID=A0A498K0K2_MALDO|nr:hypothetical protein DVH24_015029 [Malus domestica]
MVSLHVTPSAAAVAALYKRQIVWVQQPALTSSSPYSYHLLVSSSVGVLDLFAADCAWLHPWYFICPLYHHQVKDVCEGQLCLSVYVSRVCFQPFDGLVLIWCSQMDG